MTDAQRPDTGEPDVGGTSDALALTVTDADAGERVDVVIGRRVDGVSRRVARDMGLEGAIRVDGRRAPPSTRVTSGQRIELHLRPSAPERAAGSPGTAAAASDQGDAALELLATTAAFVYVAKPAGVHTHRLRPDDPPALADRVVAAFPECRTAAPDLREGGAAHRLDRDTSGVVAFARHREAWDAARQAFRDGRVGKRYLALVLADGPPRWPPDAPPDALAGWLRPLDPLDPIAAGAWDGLPEPPAGRDDLDVRAPLGPQPGRQSVEVRLDGERARTFVRQLGHAPDPDDLRMTHRLWLALQLVTGRRHQARAHLAWLGWPIEGDSVYGGTVLAGASPRLRLHAQRLDLRAVAGDERPVQAPLPPDLAARLATLGLPPI